MNRDHRSNDLGDEIARYVLGEMSQDEQVAFEVRMSNDDELARAVVAANAVDDLLYRAAKQASD